MPAPDCTALRTDSNADLKSFFKNPARCRFCRNAIPLLLRRVARKFPSLWKYFFIVMEKYLHHYGNLRASL
jgi:hypothetical protein